MVFIWTSSGSTRLMPDTSKVVVAVYIAFVMVMFALARSARHWTFAMRRQLNR
jgi:hypothetical protein